MGSDRQKNVGTKIGYLLILFLTAEVILLTYQNRELKQELKNLVAATQPMESLKPGERVEPFNVKTLDGGLSEVRYADPAKKYLLLVLSTTCPHCAKTLPVWDVIARNRPNNADVLGISVHDVDHTKKYVEESKINFYVVSVDTSFYRKYKISGVPETILVSGDGTVEKSWIGELTADQSTEIQNLMGASKTLTN